MRVFVYVCVLHRSVFLASVCEFGCDVVAFDVCAFAVRFALWRACGFVCLRPSVSYSPLPMQRVVARPYHSES